MHKCVILLIFGNIKGSYNLNGRNMSEKIFTVIFKVVKSFIEILLIYGINYRQLNQIVKLAYVDIVMNNYGIRGRNSNNSRISVITGITRKEVMKIKQIIDNKYDVKKIRPSIITKLINYWSSQKKFLNNHGEPIDLYFDEHTPNFCNLVKTLEIDIPPGAVREVLKKFQIVEITNEQKLKLLRKSFLNKDQEIEIINTFSDVLFPYIYTVSHNIKTDKYIDK